VPGSLRLKAVAPVAGFAWRDPEPGGENSMAWYRAAVSGSGEAATDDARIHRQRILDYNEDDVRATYVLRQWMSQQPDAMPTAASLA
jgi:predicted RecB family nuclease